MNQPGFDLEFQTSLSRYQKMLLRIYLLGTVLMVIFNSACYPGTYVGVCGWAALWPIYIPATLVRMWLFGDDMGMGAICPGPLAGIR